MNSNETQQFKDVMDKIVDARIENEGITKYIAAVVSSVNEDTTVNVYIPPENSKVITSLANKSGEFLSAGDSVEICAKNGSVKNAWVSVKHGKSPSGTWMEEYPIGAMVAYAGSTNIPDNWMLCDGRAVSRLVYSELFSIIGTSYGAGDGSTTFNVPDCRARFGIGAGTATGQGGESYNFQVGNNGGEYSHKLTVNEMPSHTHIATSYYDDANYNTGTIPSDYGRYSLPYDAGSVIRHQEFGATGGSAVHNNLPPFIVSNYIIKAKNKMAIIDVGSIVNTLTSTSANKALSAGMGKELDTRISELNNFLGYETKEYGGAVWLKVFYHKSNNGSVLWDSMTEMLCSFSTWKWSVLGMLDRFYNSAFGGYEFLLEYPSVNIKNRWSQTSNPVRTSDSVAGYKAISIGASGSTWGGLALSSSGTKTYLDGSPGNTDWWYAIGARVSYEGGFPGPSQTVQEVYLWVRIS